MQKEKWNYLNILFYCIYRDLSCPSTSHRTYYCLTGRYPRYYMCVQRMGRKIISLMFIFFEQLLYELFIIQNCLPTVHEIVNHQLSKDFKDIFPHCIVNRKQKKLLDQILILFPRKLSSYIIICFINQRFLLVWAKVIQGCTTDLYPTKQVSLSGTSQSCRQLLQ